MSSALAAGTALGTATLLAAKATLLLGLAVLGAAALRRSSAARRHLLWTLAIGALLALPALTLALPGWRPAFLAVSAPAPAAPAPAVYVSSEVVRFASRGPAVTITPAPVEEAGRPFPLGAVLVAVWAAGALWVLARLAVGLAAVQRMTRAAQAVADPAWNAAVSVLAARMGVRRPVRLLRGGAASMPMTWGVFRPVVLLPADAAAWSPERLRVVLLHELAHVARADCLTQVAAQAACALWWFHPGAWWAAREMRREREQACDDRVLAAEGGRASDYAAHLLGVARGCRAPAAAAALAMARPSHLEGRLRAVLDPARERDPVTARTGAVCAGAVLLAVLPLAAVSPSVCCAPAEGAGEPKRVSLSLPLQAEVGPEGTARGKTTAMARINGEDVALDLDVRVTLVPGDRATSGKESWRAPAFATPEWRPAMVSAEHGELDVSDFELGDIEGLRIEEDHGRLTVRLASNGGDVSPALFSFDVDPSIRRDLTAALARLAAEGGLSASAADALEDDCEEKRHKREAVRAHLAAGLRDARAHEPEAMAVAAMFVDLDEVVSSLSAIVADEMTVESR